jgi:fatty acid desaturase/nitrite reductase/ring-hydroxylating ferredoxin subunit
MRDALLTPGPAPAEGRRDYSLTGVEAERAVRAGLADAQWYRPPIDAERLQDLMARTNGRAARDVVLWLVLLVAAGVLAFLALGSWWAIPAFAIYGFLYGGAADARWHECGHGTAFRTPWINDAVYYVASFMLFREPTLWRWSHFRHHSDTIIVGRDPEILFMRPFRLRALIPNLLQLQNGPQMLWRMVRHAAGSIDTEARDFVPPDEQRRLVWEARAFVAILLGVVVWSVSTWSIVPLLFIGLPTFYGAPLLYFFAVTQHAGLREDVLDHRLNTRTVYMNPVLRFLYLNMNYHVEHHLFPSVPYRNLPALHAELKDHLPPPKPNVLAAYREVIGALRHQRVDPAWEVPDLQVPDDRATAGYAKGAATVAIAETVAEGHTDLGSVDAVEPGGILRVDVHGATYVLCRPSADVYALVDGFCTHGQAHLADGLLIDGCIECPKHNGRFDVVTGEPVRRPARVPLGTYHVEVVGGRLVADLRPADTAG